MMSKLIIFTHGHCVIFNSFTALEQVRGKFRTALNIAMELFAKIVSNINLKLFTILTKKIHLRLLNGS